MPIRIRCSGCDKPLKVPDKFAGGRIRCPGCDALINVPELAGSSDSPTEDGSAAPEKSPDMPQKKSPGKSPVKSPDKSPDKLPSVSSTAVPDEWLFGDESPGGGGHDSTSDEYGLPAPTAPPPRVNRKSKSSTFVMAWNSSDPADGGQRPQRAAAAEGLAIASPTTWRDQLFWVLLAAIAPLAISTIWQGRPTVDRFKETLSQLPDDAVPDPAQHGAQQAEDSVDDFFNKLPEHRIVGAHLARDSSVHWGYAALSATLFLSLLTFMFPNDAAGPSRLIWTGLITGTIGIILLLGFQWVAHYTQGFNVRGRGIIVVLFYIVKFIGYSYRAALDPENGFPLSFMGFTCGVGLCEELCKALPVVLFLRAKPHCGWRAACVVGLASGVGFGVSEGITYSGDSYNGIAEGMTYVVRFASCVALHADLGGGGGADDESQSGLRRRRRLRLGRRRQFHPALPGDRHDSARPVRYAAQEGHGNRRLVGGRRQLCLARLAGVARAAGGSERLSVKPTRLQYFFAGNWPVIIWMVSFTILCPLAVGFGYWPIVDLYGDWNHWLVFLGVVLLAFPLGYFGAILVGWFVIGPLFYDRSVKNGEPFHEGDLVHILVGSHRDHVARVEKAWDAEPWAGGHRVRLAPRRTGQAGRRRRLRITPGGPRFTRKSHRFKLNAAWREFRFSYVV